MPAIGRQRAPVGAEHAADEVVDPVMLAGRDDLLDRDDQRRVAGDPRLAVDHLGELRERLETVLRLGLGYVLLEPLDLLPAGVRRGAYDILGLDACVPELEVAHPRELAHRLAIRPRRGRADRRPSLGIEGAVAAGHGEACDEPLDVPLERAGQGLVEVVDAEDEAPIGGGEPAEVGEVRVAAELHLQAGPRRVGEIRCHVRRGPAEERER